MEILREKNKTICEVLVGNVLCVMCNEKGKCMTCYTSESSSCARRAHLSIAGGVLACQSEVQHVHATTVRRMPADTEVTLLSQ